MKLIGLGKVPWDMTVFLGITIAGFGLSVKKLAYPGRLGDSAYSATAARTIASLPDVKESSIDLGCLERRAGILKTLSDQDRVKIKGSFCNLGRSIPYQSLGLRVKNLSTGFEGTLFLQSGGFVSSELSLKPGKNILQLEWTDKNSGQLRLVRAEVFEK